MKVEKEAKKQSFTFEMVQFKKEKEQPPNSELILVDDGAP